MNPKSKILPKIAIAMILFSVLLANFSFVQAQTQPTGPSGPFIQKPFPTLSAINQMLATDQQQSKESDSNCLPKWFGGAGLNLKICLAEIEAVFGDAAIWTAGLALGLTENMFNYALSENLNPARFDPNQQAIIKFGWTQTRDIVNLLFIFILLIIAIAVIIGWETYGIKKALPTFIIIILLINFSLLFSRYVVEFSNTLAEYLYCQIFDLKQPCFDKSEILEVSSLLHVGLKPSNLLQPYKGTVVIEQLDADIQKYKDLEAKKILPSSYTQSKIKEAEAQQQLALSGDVTAVKNKNNIFTTIFFVTVFGAILLLVAAFVFLSAAILLVIRVVMLWILMIFAPAALLLWALPATAGYGRTWLNYLLNQAFFFPVFVFFLFLSIKLTTGMFTAETTAQFSKSIVDVALGVDNSIASTALLDEGYMFNYAIVIVMMLASLHFARSMASHGASQIITFGDKARGYALGAAKVGGQYAWMGTSYAPRYGLGRGYEAVMGRIMRPPKIEKTETGEERVVDKGGILHRTLGVVAPGIRGRIRAGMKGGIEELKKEHDQRTSADIAATFGRKFTTPEDRTSMLSVLAGRRDLDELAKAGVKPELIEATINFAKSSGVKTTDIERLKYQWKDWDLMSVKEREETVKKIRPQDINKAIEESDSATKKLLEGLQGSARGIEEMADNLQAINPALAKWIRFGLGRWSVEGYLFGGPQGGARKEQPGQGWLPGMGPKS